MGKAQREHRKGEQGGHREGTRKGHREGTGSAPGGHRKGAQGGHRERTQGRDRNGTETGHREGTGKGQEGHREGTGKGQGVHREDTGRAQGRHREGRGRAQGRDTGRAQERDTGKSPYITCCGSTVPRSTGSAGTWNQGQMGSADIITQILETEREGAQSAPTCLHCSCFLLGAVGLGWGCLFPGQPPTQTHGSRAAVSGWH